MTNKGMKYITNGVDQKMIHVNDSMPEGYHFGKKPISDETREILSKSHIGKKLSKESIYKRQKTFQERYGVSSCSQLPGVSEKISQKLSSKEVQDHMKQTNIEKYGVEHSLQNSEILQKKYDTMLDRYGDKHFNNKPKEYETKKKNNSFNTSKPEKEILKLLKNEFGEEDVENQFCTLEYPFNCDFYIKSLNVYIEYHGTWTHGGHPFNQENSDDMKQLDLWKTKCEPGNSYENAIYTWTDLDVRKRKYIDKINLIIFYPDKHDDIVSSFKKLKAELDSYKK